MKKYNRISDIMRNQGRTQTWLVDKVKFTKNSISMNFLNKSQPSLQKLYKISKALEVPAFTLIGDYEGRAKKEEALKTLSEYLPQEVIDELAYIIAEEE